MKKLVILLTLIIISSPLSSCKGGEKGANLYNELRLHMVDRQIKSRGIVDKSVLTAMGTVPREKFVPTDIRKMAYADRPLPIGRGQTISQPYIVALMTELVRPDKTKKVLEIGAGSGYAAAILSEVAGEVYTVEIDPDLAKSAGKLLKELGYNNVHVKEGDGFYGWPEKAPFDAILITCSAEKVPEKLFEQLKEGGRMVLPLGEELSVQTLVVIRKEDGKIKQEPVIPVRFVPMTGKVKEQ